jgi:hypothetical protein
MRKALMISVIAVAILFVPYKTFSQCNCQPSNTTYEDYKRADAVFVGKITEIKKLGSDDTEFVIKFEVKKTWKQDMQRFVTVRLSSENISKQSEGFYQVNAEWLLFASKSEDGNFKASVHCCTKTKPFSTALEGGVFKSFKEMKLKPKKIIDER